MLPKTMALMYDNVVAALQALANTIPRPVSLSFQLFKLTACNYYGCTALRRNCRMIYTWQTSLQLSQMWQPFPHNLAVAFRSGKKRFHL